MGRTIKRLEKGCGLKESLGDSGCEEGHLCDECWARIHTLRDVLREIDKYINEMELKVVTMKKKYVDRPSTTRERTYLQYRKALRYFYKLKEKLVGK